MNPLTLLATGVYGKTLPNKTEHRSGWSYHGNMALKGLNLSSKFALLSKCLTRHGTYQRRANMAFCQCESDVSHPRWSQATERFIGAGGLGQVTRQPTLLFNGYGEQVASLYQGMDLRRYY